MKTGSLIVVGTGISVGHLTAETRSYIERADKLLYLVADPATERLVQLLNSTAESLHVYYDSDKERSKTYAEMVQRIMDCVREGLNVCAAFYGHPGIFVQSSHESIRVAREEGYSARMLPGISSLDCLFCDLGVDPAWGCQIFEATELLLRNRQIDIGGPVVVWQIGCVGNLSFSPNGCDARYLQELVEYLSTYYGKDHEVVIYEAAHYSICEPVISRVQLSKLTGKDVKGMSTMYIPPAKRWPVLPSAVKRLNLNSLFEEERRAVRQTSDSSSRHTEFPSSII